VPFECPPPAVKGLPDTGQTKCYDAAGAETPCDSATCPGQDAVYATGCPSEGHFVDHGDGTVSDTCTRLMWQKDTADTNGDGQANSIRWCDALAYCENLTFAGHDDWRLPNARELQSIVDYGRNDPSIDPIFGAFSTQYWSSTSDDGSPSLAWYVGFGVGSAGLRLEGKTAGYYVRAVRTAP